MFMQCMWNVCICTWSHTLPQKKNKDAMVAYLSESARFLKLVHTYKHTRREKRGYTLTVRLHNRPSPSEVVQCGVMPPTFLDRIDGKYWLCVWLCVIVVCNSVCLWLCVCDCVCDCVWEHWRVWYVCVIVLMFVWICFCFAVRNAVGMTSSFPISIQILIQFQY